MTTAARNKLAQTIRASARTAGRRPLPVGYDVILSQLDSIERRLDAALGHHK